MSHILKLACVVTLSLSLWGCSAKDDVSQPVATSEVETATETQPSKPAAKPKNAMGFDATLSLRENLEGKNRFVLLTRAMKGAHPSGELGPEYTNITIFAPSNKAFQSLPKESTAELMQPQNRDLLNYLISAHMVQGKIDRARIEAEIIKGGGTYNLATIRGTNIKFTRNGEDIIVSNDGAETAKILIANGEASDGYVHLIDTVLEPK